jgi:hypothetical protein
MSDGAGTTLPRPAPQKDRRWRDILALEGEALGFGQKRLSGLKDRKKSYRVVFWIQIRQIPRVEVKNAAKL